MQERAARWVASARQQLSIYTRDILREKLAVQPSALDSIIALVRSRIDVSVERILTAS